MLDEAYVDFARENALALALKYPHVLVARTFSKAYSLCFQRVGYCRRPPGPDRRAPQDPRQLQRQWSRPGCRAAPHWMTCPTTGPTSGRIIATRERLSRELEALGFRVFPSQTNFIFVRPPRLPARTWLQKLRDRKMLVRWFSDPAVRDYLRITIGTPEEAAALVQAARALL